MNRSKIDLAYAVKRLEDYEVVVKSILAVKKVNALTLEEKICRLYVIEQNAADIAKTINDMGERINGRKYISKDITNIVKQSQSYCGKVAKAFFNYNNTVANGTRNFNQLIRTLKESVESGQIE